MLFGHLCVDTSHLGSSVHHYFFVQLNMSFLLSVFFSRRVKKSKLRGTMYSKGIIDTKLGSPTANHVKLFKNYYSSAYRTLSASKAPRIAPTKGATM